MQKRMKSFISFSKNRDKKPFPSKKKKKIQELRVKLADVHTQTLGGRKTEFKVMFSHWSLDDGTIFQLSQIQELLALAIYIISYF